MERVTALVHHFHQPPVTQPSSSEPSGHAAVKQHFSYHLEPFPKNFIAIAVSFLAKQDIFHGGCWHSSTRPIKLVPGQVELCGDTTGHKTFYI